MNLVTLKKIALFVRGFSTIVAGKKVGVLSVGLDIL